MIIDEIYAQGGWKPFLEKGFYRSVVLDGRTYDICLKEKPEDKRKFKGQWEAAMIESFRKEGNTPVAKAVNTLSTDSLAVLMNKLDVAFKRHNDAYTKKERAGRVPLRTQEV